MSFTYTAGIAAGASLAAISIALSLFPAAGLDSPLTTWVAMNATQCANPWDEGKQTVAEYFRDRGILTYGERRISYLQENMLVCSGCSCPSGSTLYLEVANHDSERMISEYGFVGRQQPRL